MPIRVGKFVAQAGAVVALAAVLSGCALAGRSFGRYVDDKSVTGGVKMRLAAAHLSHLKRVKVDVYDGVVYLSGTVDTAEEKADAESAARNTPGTEQVVNDVVVRGRGSEAVSALPVQRPRHTLTERFPFVARVESGTPGGPDHAFDGQGRLVATVYTLSARRIDVGIATLPVGGRPVDRVSIYPILAGDDLPESLYAVVLWHVAERTATRR